MLLKEVKNFVLDKIKLHILLLLAFILILFMLVSLYRSTNINIETSTKKFTQLNQDLKKLNSDIERFKQNIKLWNSKLHLIYESRNGLQLDTIQRIIEDGRLIHNIRGLTVNLTSPQLRNNLEASQFIDIEYSKIIIDFDAFNDIDAVKFISFLNTTIPGNIKITNLKIQAVPEINGTIIDYSNFGSPKIKPIVDGKLELLWQDFQDKR